MRLPAEVWVLVFGFLSPADRLRARAVCTLWRRLVDRGASWRNWTVDLTRAKGARAAHFWRTLRRWRVTSAQLTAPRSWTHVAAELPRLTALIISGYRQERVDSFRCFTRLERVYLRQCSLRVALRGLLALLPQQLTHVRVCDCSGPVLDEPGVHALSQLTRLQSFTFHGTCSLTPRWVLYRILFHLPDLRHLSLSARLSVPPTEETTLRNLPPLQQRALRSLELVDCSAWSFSVDVMKMVPCVRSLALFFREDPGGAWLQELPPVSSLLVHGPRVGALTGSVPSTVTRLTLLPTRLSSSELTALSARLPDLRHLHLDPRAPLDTDAVPRIPRLFPALRSLCLRHEGLREEALWSLAALEELRLVETLDAVPLSTARASTLRDLTQNRVQTRTRPDPDPLWTCACAHHVPTETWTKPGLNRD